MTGMGYEGPLDHWQTELRKCSRSGLIERLEIIFSVYGIDRDNALRIAQTTKRTGRMIDSLAASARYCQDPHKAIAEYVRRKQSSKKAATRRKREAKKKGKA